MLERRKEHKEKELNFYGSQDICYNLGTLNNWLCQENILVKLQDGYLVRRRRPSNRYLEFCKRAC